MGVIYGTNQVFLPATDDGFVGPIDIPLGFPFGSSVQTQVFVSALVCHSCCNFTLFDLLSRLEQMDSSHLVLDTTAFQIRFSLEMQLFSLGTWWLLSGMMLILDLTLEIYHMRYTNLAITWTKSIHLSKERGLQTLKAHG